MIDQKNEQKHPKDAIELTEKKKMRGVETKKKKNCERISSKKTRIVGEVPVIFFDF